MSDTVNGDDKKEEKWEKKKAPGSKDECDEKVTVKKNVGTAKAPKFLKAVPDVPAVRSLIGDKNVVYTWKPGGDTETPPGSEITLVDGTAYIVDKVTKGDAYHINYVTKKPSDKKP